VLNWLKYFFFFTVTLNIIITNAQDKIKWTYLSDLNDSLSKSTKQILLKIETDWCGYCKLMDEKVFSHKKIINKFKNDFYFIKIDGECKDSLHFDKKWYYPSIHQKRGGVHELAKFFGEENGRLNYPCIVILDENLVVEKRIQGYLKRNDFIHWLQID